MVCRLRALHGHGRKACSDVTLDPPLPGTWRWTDDRLLSFTPFTDWPAGTRYTVRLPESSLPPATRVEQPISFVTQSVKVAGSGAFRVDPQNPREMAVSGSIRFSFPMRKESVSATAELPEGSKTLIGEPVFLWDENGLELSFSVPVRALDVRNGILRVNVARGAMVPFRRRACRGSGTQHQSARKK